MQGFSPWNSPLTKITRHRRESNPGPLWSEATTEPSGRTVPFILLLSAELYYLSLVVACLVFYIVLPHIFVY